MTYHDVMMLLDSQNPNHYPFRSKTTWLSLQTTIMTRILLHRSTTLSSGLMLTTGQSITNTELNMINGNYTKLLLYQIVAYIRMWYTWYKNTYQPDKMRHKNMCLTVSEISTPPVAMATWNLVRQHYCSAGKPESIYETSY